MDLTKFILPTELQNNDENGKLGDSSYNTKDLIYIDSYEDLVKYSNGYNALNKICYATDFVAMNGAYLKNYDNKSNTAECCVNWTRSSGSKYQVKVLKNNNVDSFYATSYKSGVIRPSLHLDLSAVVSEIKNFSGLFPIKKSKMKEFRNYYTIEFGEFPKTYVGDDKNKELNELYELKRINMTGKKYLGYLNENKNIKDIGAPEFKYKGQKYVRVKSNLYNLAEYEVPNKEYAWVKVEPITWIIRNWDEMPKEINPNGLGTATFIDVKSEQAIFGDIRFYLGYTNKYGFTGGQDKYCNMWQNSTIRGYLNGINVNNIKTNGNLNFTAPNGGDFSGKNNFLKEAFNVDISNISKRTQEISLENELEKEFENSKPVVRKSRLDKLNPDKTSKLNRVKMTDTEIIKSWIDEGQSVLLRGPSGIGKTERIKKLYPDLIYIKLTNNMFPEKVVGSMNLQTGQSIPPDFAKHAIMSCATEDEKKLIKENIQNLYDLSDTIYERSKNSDKKVVIMLDELLNVKPAVQSLVYTLVLNKIVETGKGLKLPANTVVVATGNQKKYSNVAEDLAEPLEKRFDHILDMQPKVGEWLSEYAIPNKIHPSVIGYIFSKYRENRKSEDIDDMGYFYEEPETGEKQIDENGCRGRTNDPRGWVSISNTLYAFEEDLKNGKFIGKDVENMLRVTINSKLRIEWAEEFIDFYNHPVISVEEVVSNNYSKADLPRDINEKFACLSGLLGADENQVVVCRDFIKKYCDPEYLSVYDIYWVGNDENRMLKLSELKELETLDDNENDTQLA